MAVTTACFKGQDRMGLPNAENNRCGQPSQRLHVPRCQSVAKSLPHKELSLLRFFFNIGTIGREKKLERRERAKSPLGKMARIGAMSRGAR